MNDQRILTRLPLESSIEESPAIERKSPVEPMANSEEDRKVRKKALKAKWEREKRLRETPEERKRRLNGMRRYQAKYKAQMTVEQKRSYLDSLQQKRAIKRAAASEEEKAAEREYFRLKAIERRQRNNIEILEYRRNWHAANKEKVNARKRERRKNPSEKAKISEYDKLRREKDPASIRMWKKNWDLKNREHIRSYSNKRHSFRYKNDPEYAVSKNLRSRMLSALKVASARKSAKTFALLGCTGAELVAHLERQFTDGMTWENYGKWHVDHRKPCAKFNLLDPLEQQKCFHFSNLQPLWSTDNWKKKDKWTEPAPDPSEF